eukprot:TRINITY_DN27571_c0_g1_i1.p1 TRINITY_DN27571_c0_g1~~TRINITY_DN27571_c0_g1_i1.p1  ORF type:complete len:185 (+),score=11.03 TRINITY_DN27571_c0_g1_i1:68-556(+)
MANGRPTTSVWRVGENSMSRLSFNAIVSKKPYDMPEDMWKSYYMGRQAELGPEYIHNGVMSRVLAGTLTATRADPLKQCYVHRPGSAPFPQPGMGDSGAFSTMTLPKLGPDHYTSRSKAWDTVEYPLNRERYIRDGASRTPSVCSANSSSRSWGRSMSTPLL